MSHIATAFTALGGLGLFLLGMIIMTDGLRQMAGDSLRSALTRFTRNPLSGTITGAISTAILQSSSATTVAAVGFVGVGLLKFTEALGIIFGANLGTTITGWFVALLGFKFKIGVLALPLIFMGTSLKLFSKGRWSEIGLALAGFGLIFVGISTMQEGMSGFQGIITPDDLPQDSFAGRIQLVLMGMIATILTQSSSAGVAATMTALHMGNINFGQAMGLVIGMDIGTTVTALLATIGGSVGSRRTGFSHVCFNLMTGVLALLLITPYIKIWETFSPGSLLANAEIGLVGFHSFFNLMGLAVMLPFTYPFARLIERLVPDKPSKHKNLLDKSLLKDSRTALDMAQKTQLQIGKKIIGVVEERLSSNSNKKSLDLPNLQLALDELHQFVDEIELDSTDSLSRKKLIGVIHTMDHLQRLHERCEEEPERAETARSATPLHRETELVRDTVLALLGDMENGNWKDSIKQAKFCLDQLEDFAPKFRDQVMVGVADGKLEVPDATAQLEAIRWLRRVSRHLYQIANRGIR